MCSLPARALLWQTGEMSEMFGASAPVTESRSHVESETWVLGRLRGEINWNSRLMDVFFLNVIWGKTKVYKEQE